MSYYGPTETTCRECEEVKPYKGGEVDVEDHPDTVYPQREVFHCADCVRAWSTAVGDRIELVWLDDPFSSLEPGARGVVQRVIKGPPYLYEQISVRWDDGSGLMLLPGIDQWKVIS